MLFVSITLWALVISTTSGLRSCEDCVELSKCPQADEKVRNDYNDDLVTKLRNAQCGLPSVSEFKICCSDFHTDDEDDEIKYKDEIENHPNLHLLSNDCGTKREYRIIGGERANLYEFPWLVLLSRKEEGRYKFYCGGTLINSRYVLTAAHCLKGYDIVGVRAGEHDLSKRNACYGSGKLRQCELEVQDIRVSHVIIHPDYSNKKNVIPVHDIGLLRLKKPVDLSVLNADLICLPVSRNLRERDLPGEIGVIAGWGWTENNANQLSDILLKVDVPISSSETCSYSYLRNRYGVESLFENVLCADEAGIGSCKGDSGGPLMLEDDEGMKYVQYGIVSYGIGCGTAKPSVYTDVRKYMKWILDTIQP